MDEDVIKINYNLLRSGGGKRHPGAVIHFFPHPLFKLVVHSGTGHCLPLYLSFLFKKLLIIDNRYYVMYRGREPE